LNKSWSDEFRKIEPDFSYCTKVHDCYHPSHSSFEGFGKSFEGQTTVIENWFNDVRVGELEVEIRGCVSVGECGEAVEKSVDYIRNKEKFEISKRECFEGNELLFGEIEQSHRFLDKSDILIMKFWNKYFENAGTNSERYLALMKADVPVLAITKNFVMKFPIKRILSDQEKNTISVRDKSTGSQKYETGVKRRPATPVNRDRDRFCALALTKDRAGQITDTFGAPANSRDGSVLSGSNSVRLFNNSSIRRNYPYTEHKKEQVYNFGQTSNLKDNRMPAKVKKPSSNLLKEVNKVAVRTYEGQTKTFNPTERKNSGSQIRDKVLKIKGKSLTKLNLDSLKMSFKDN
jgi:hypothetical protein